MQNYSKGDVIHVNLGSPPKEVIGHEQGLIRPCIVIKSFTSLKLVIVIPLTSKEPKYSLFTIVKIPKDGLILKLDSYALCHQIRTISFDRIVTPLGKLERMDVLKIQAVLTDMLDL
jgi:mRNA interferase MazF